MCLVGNFTQSCHLSPNFGEKLADLHFLQWADFEPRVSFEHFQSTAKATRARKVNLGMNTNLFCLEIHQVAQRN